MANYATTDQLIIRVNMLTAPSAAELAYLEELIEVHVAHDRAKWYTPPPTLLPVENVSKSHRGEEVTI